MGRDKGTNDYSNNFEPQVTGLLDARTRVDTKADLLLASTWTSSDGNVYLPRGIRVSVTNDSIAANNGVYMLMDEDYSVASNWLQINGKDTPSNVKVLTTSDLLNTSRTSTINLSAADIAIIQGLSVGKDILVYNGVVGATTAYIPLTVMNAGSGNIQMYNITFAQAGALYTFSISTTNKVTYTVSILKKVEGSGGVGGESHDLSIDVRINRDKLSKKQTVQYRIKQQVENGYICFLRKKKCSNSRADYRRNKYTVPELSFSNGFEVNAIDVFAIPCNRANLNEWTDFPNFDAYIAGSNTIPNERFYFKGNVHCKPCVFHPATGSANKRTAVLHCGLQYLVLNPNFVNGILENNAKPKDVLMSGDMVKFKVRLQCVNTNNFASGYNLIYSIY